MNQNINRGPYDSQDISAPAELANFGSISFVPNGLVTVRAEVEDGTGRVLAISFDYLQSTLQVQAFASPRGENIWTEVLEDIQANIISQGGSVQPQTGPFGAEIIVSAVLPNGETHKMRMFGFSGDRWLLKGTVTGATMDEMAIRLFLEDVFRGIVVNRGETPLPPRELLPLELPEGAIVPKGNL